jgi:uncharacterized protein YdbL (DUF1318 family)
MKKNASLLLTTLFSILFLSSTAAHALSLDEAKGTGVVGETPSGYLEVVQQSPDASVLVKEVNSKRREQYEGIAQKNSTPLKAVEELAGRKAIEKTAKGNYVKIDGKWVKK